MSEKVTHNLSVTVLSDTPGSGRWQARAYCTCKQWTDDTDRADVQNLLTGVGYRFALHVGEQRQ